MIAAAALLLMALLQPGAECGCGPNAQPWQLYEPPIGSTLTAQYLEQLSPPPGEWCVVGNLTRWVCSGLYHDAQCHGQWVAVGREPIEPASRWILIDERGENCLPCREECSVSPIFTDGFETSDISRWSRTVP